MRGELSMRTSWPRTTPLHDERYTERAFAAYRQEHGFEESIRLGDMPVQVVSDILRRAQKLKEAESR